MATYSSNCDTTGGTAASNHMSYDISTTNATVTGIYHWIEVTSSTCAVPNITIAIQVDTYRFDEALNEFVGQAVPERLQSEPSERQKAEEKAALLLADLFELVNDHIVVPSSVHEGREYHINKQGEDMVKVMENGKQIHKLCAHPSPVYPQPDHAITQALFLQGQEEEFLRIANVH